MSQFFAVVGALICSAFLTAIIEYIWGLLDGTATEHDPYE